MLAVNDACMHLVPDVFIRTQPSFLKWWVFAHRQSWNLSAVYFYRTGTGTLSLSCQGSTDTTSKNLISFLCLSKQWLSRWILVAIALTYTSRGLQPPAGLQTHYWRFGIIVGCLHSVQRLADLSFAEFYSLDVTAASLADSVLSVGATDGDLFPITGLWSDPGVSISHSETLTHAT